MNYLIIVTGPTGIGKTNLSIQLAEHFSTEIISADSRQIYREMKIGTAVPSEQELQKIKHHFINSVSIHDYYNVSRYEHEAIEVIENLHKKNPIVILTGGTGLYIDAICNGIDLMPDPEPNIRLDLNNKFKTHGLLWLQNKLKQLDEDYYNVVDLNNHARLIRALEVCIQTGKTYSSYRTSKHKPRNFQFIKIALNSDRNLLYSNINKRVELMVQAGLIEEARTLYQYKNISALKTVGYQELFEAFDGNISIEKAIETIQNNTRRYARKQISWIKRDPNYNWFGPNQIQEIIVFINSMMG